MFWQRLMLVHQALCLTGNTMHLNLVQSNSKCKLLTTRWV